MRGGDGVEILDGCGLSLTWCDRPGDASIATADEMLTVTLYGSPWRSRAHDDLLVRFDVPVVAHRIDRGWEWYGPEQIVIDGMPPLVDVWISRMCVSAPNILAAITDSIDLPLSMPTPPPHLISVGERVTIVVPHKLARVSQW